MTNASARAARPHIRLERSYDAAVEDLWDLWTTKEGFESWWGPEGFRVEVHKLDLRVGGELFYDMIATGADQIEYMQKAGRPLSHETRGTFVEVAPFERLEISHLVDFIPGVEPYENHVCAEFFREGKNARMVITVEPHQSEEFTRLSTMGWESQLTKIPAALAARQAKSSKPS